MAKLGKPYQLIETEDEMIRIYGRRMNINQISHEIGIKNWNAVKKFVAGLNPLVIDGRRMYKTTDVAELIWLNTEGD